MNRFLRLRKFYGWFNNCSQLGFFAFVRHGMLHMPDDC